MVLPLGEPLKWLVKLGIFFQEDYLNFKDC